MAVNPFVEDCIGLSLSVSRWFRDVAVAKKVNVNFGVRFCNK